MLDGVVAVLFKYCSTAFIHRAKLLKNRTRIRQVDRFIRIFLARSYRTVSYLPLTVITGRPPLDYMMEKRTITYLYAHDRPIPWNNLRLSPPADMNTRRYTGKELGMALDEEILRLWQGEWSESTKGAWTRKIMPEVQIHDDECDFYLTQGLTGHGVFNEYLHRFKRRETPMCPCLQGQQTVEHVLTECLMFEEGRPSVLDQGKTEYIRSVVRKLWLREREGRATPVEESSDGEDDEYLSI